MILNLIDIAKLAKVGNIQEYIIVHNVKLVDLEWITIVILLVFVFTF
jgi:hypothetical protein